MNLFRILVEKERGKIRDPRTWVVFAGSLFEAVSLIPEGFTVRAIEVQVGAVPGSGRVIGRVDAPTFH